ncbi:sulfatase [Sedimentisphaera salicampi]|uniref:Arylsulfatase n=1 Tax=Sedimentisphaera salicampi TaxID=1941349 RepID=A0A1W6LK50_9BACT|nr:sulfatase [Sedimentisphaera salicampi]ARN56161.1 Arylsulfatase [Sedimentisphaera salicampi]
MAVFNDSAESARIHSRRSFLKCVGVGFAALSLPSLADVALAAKPSRKKPNVIVFFTDDQGWTDTSVRMMKDRKDSRSYFYQTPALEQMAREGMVFSDAYSPAPTCTPSRAGVQFGKTTARLKQTVVHDRLAFDRGIDLKDQVSIPHMIKKNDPDYVNGYFGKWGFHPRGPEHCGYDEHDGNTNNGEGDYLSVQNKTPLPADDPKRIFSITEKAEKFMEDQVKAKKPFFLELAHYAVHVDHMALEETVEKYRKLAEEKGQKFDNEKTAVYAAMIENLDSGLQAVLDKVESLGIKENTYIIFTSDNGGGFGGNAPLKGGKGSIWEGGIRVPTVVCGPDVLKGSYCNVPVTGWDIYPTVNEITGGRPLPEEYDGGSLLDLFKKGNKGKIPRGTKELIFHYPWYGNMPPMSAIRDGDYKLVMSLNNDEYRLYDLAEDIGEKNDLKSQKPELAKKLHNRLLQYLKNVDAEDVEDMRHARKREVEGYRARELEKENPSEERLKNFERELQMFEDNRKLGLDGKIIKD